MTRFDRWLTPRLLLGLLVILLGVALTLENLGLIDADRLIRFWPLALVGIGAVRLRSSATADLFVGVLWVGLGGWLLAYNFELTAFSPYRFVVPILFVALGTRLAFGTFPRRGWTSADGSTASTFALLGSNTRRISSPGLRRAEAAAIFAGCELDLTQASLAPDGAVVDTFALWGGIDVRVPAGWQVISRVTPVLGSFNDETAQQPASDAPRLEVRGTVIMGGVTVKN